MKRILASLLIIGLCLLASGCAHCCWLYRPFGPGTLCTGGPCGGCGGGCATPACGAPTCDSCAAPACDSCGSEPCACESPCDSCGGGCAGSCGGGCAGPCGGGPITWLFTLLNGGYCGDGCGEMWWGDFHSAPPTCCEPCNRMGQWTGNTGGGPVLSGEGSGAGCSSCGGGSTIDYTFQQQPRVLVENPSQVARVSRQAARPISTVQR